MEGAQPKVTPITQWTVYDWLEFGAGYLCAVLAWRVIGSIIKKCWSTISTPMPRLRRRR